MININLIKSNSKSERDVVSAIEEARQKGGGVVFIPVGKCEWQSELEKEGNIYIVGVD